MALVFRTGHRAAFSQDSGRGNGGRSCSCRTVVGSLLLARLVWQPHGDEWSSFLAAVEHELFSDCSKLALLWTKQGLLSGAVDMLLASL